VTPLGAAAILGVHATARGTGIVRRAGTDLAGWCHLDRGDTPAGYLTGVLGALEGLGQAGDRVALVALPAPAALAGTGVGYGALCRALLLGALLADPGGWAPPLLVAPADYGAWLLAGYPPALVGQRERRGVGRLRGCRAAWDLAGAAVPGGPPSAAADRARLPELAAIEQRACPGYAAVLVAHCGVCGAQQYRYVHQGDDLDQAGEVFRAEYADHHVGLHLRASGRAGSLLLDPAPSAIPARPARPCPGGVGGWSR
jgi:hypothetical protein